MVLQAVVSQQLISCKDGRVVPAFEIMLCNPAIRTMIREYTNREVAKIIEDAEKTEIRLVPRLLWAWIPV